MSSILLNERDTFSHRLLAWHDEFGRKQLPWQCAISPYSVWISEIMLQQTQVNTVIPYYKRFLQFFPTVNKLAHAPLDQVLHLWTGLGYYARARNLHKAANIICEQFNGELPNNLAALTSLPGIGRSTAGAILSIAYNIATPILDGNVKRVLTRYHAITGLVTSKLIDNQLWLLAEKYTPTYRAQQYTQAIMDLGATVCTRSKPHCEICPLNQDCLAFKEKRQLEFPQRKKKSLLPTRTTQFLIIKDEQGAVFLQKRPLVGLWGGLWAFPECSNNDISTYCSQYLSLKVKIESIGQLYKHTFSHFHLEITPIYLSLIAKPCQMMESETLWCYPTHLPQIGLAAPIVELLKYRG